MTVSRERRLEDRAFVLRTLAIELGDEMVVRKWWDVDRTDFSEVLPTTWAELEEQGLLTRHKRLNPPPAYELTLGGWVAGLRLAGVLDGDPFRARCIELVKWFKAHVAGRRLQHDAIVSHHEVHRAFPSPWVLNVVESGALTELFPGKRMNARWDRTQKVFRVPVTFGMPD